MNIREWIKNNWPLVVVAFLAAAFARYGFPVSIQWSPDYGNPTRPETIPPPKIAPKADPLNAIAKISSSGTGCSATVIGPRRVDGKWWILSAAHCVKAAGQQWTCLFRDGRKVVATVVNFDRRSDWSWLLTNEAHDSLPFAYLCDATPEPGTAIWHAGFGVHVPGNVEEGKVTGKVNSSGQVPMLLSVSSGDSGGGIFRKDDGRLFSCVCCTSGKGRVADTFGAAVEQIRAGRSERINLDPDYPSVPLSEMWEGSTDGEEEDSNVFASQGS